MIDMLVRLGDSLKLELRLSERYGGGTCGEDTLCRMKLSFIRIREVELLTHS